MYTAYKRKRKYPAILRFLLIMAPFVLIIFIFIWFVLLKNTDFITTNFSKSDAKPAVIKQSTSEYSNEYFKLTLPSSWQSLGQQNPRSTEVYYEFQDTVAATSNRWLRVYVDVFPSGFPINRALPVTVANNKVTPGNVSDDCSTFEGAPSSGSASGGSSWLASWQDVSFVCAINTNLNYVGAVESNTGISIPLLNSNNTKHNYFFLYIDHNSQPDYSIFSNALKSFETI